MTVVFISNYFNHHQQPLSDALYALTEGHYAFISTDTVSQERKQLGYQTDAFPDYVISAQLPLAGKLIDEADVVIFGSAPESLIANRRKSGGLIFRYYERPLKNGPEPLKHLPRLIRWHRRNPPGKPIYLLCASAYTAGDYARFGLFRRRSFRFGYFPPLIRYSDPVAMIARKAPASILWVGRFLELKHPETALEAARLLKQEGLDFTLTFIGTGEQTQAMTELITRWDLSDRVFLRGPLSPEQVREEMEKATVLLLTSDRREGWGAVVNEAMNGGCVPVISDAVGSVPYLIRPGENGMVFPCGDARALYLAVRELLTDPERREAMGLNAYNTIAGQWNAEIAAQRLLTLSHRILNGEQAPACWDDGPCSPDDGRGNWRTP